MKKKNKEVVETVDNKDVKKEHEKKANKWMLGAGILALISSLLGLIRSLLRIF